MASVRFGFSGPDLPHDWMSDVSPDEVIEGRDALIQFDQAWIDRCMAALPELADVADLLAASRRGIVFGGRTARVAAGEIEAVGASTGTHRLGHLFALLSVLAEAPDHDIEYMTVDHFPALDAAHGRAATEAGLQYILENFTGFLNDPQLAQQSPHEQRGDLLARDTTNFTVGAKGAAGWHTMLFGRRQELEVGYSARFDAVGEQQQTSAEQHGEQPAHLAVDSHELRHP